MDELIRNLLKLQTLEFSDSRDEDTAEEMAELRSKIPAQILGHFDRFVVRGKKALVAVSHQVCTGCHMRLPLAVVMTLKHGTDIQLCDSCGRYLYLVDDASPATARPLEMKPARSGRGRRRTNTPSASLPVQESALPAVPPQPRLSPE